MFKIILIIVICSIVVGACKFVLECANGSSGPNGPNSESEPTGVDTEYSRALTILGLFNTPTKSELDKAYKKLIRKYHPDNGGSEEMCMQLNQARDYVAKYNGWE